MQNNERVDADLQEILDKPLLHKVYDMLHGIEGNILVLCTESEECEDPVEYARYGGFVEGLSVCRGAIRAILRLEDQRINR